MVPRVFLSMVRARDIKSGRDKLADKLMINFVGLRSISYSYNVAYFTAYYSMLLTSTTLSYISCAYFKKKMSHHMLNFKKLIKIKKTLITF